MNRYQLPVGLLLHFGRKLESWSWDLAYWPPNEEDRPQFEHYLEDGLAGARMYGEQGDFAWVLAHVLESPLANEIWKDLEAGGQQPWTYEPEESLEFWQEALPRFCAGHICQDAATRIELIGGLISDWRNRLDLHVFEIPIDLVEFYLDDTILDHVSYAGFGCEIEADTLRTLPSRSHQYGEQEVLRCVVEHLIDAPAEVLAQLARPGRAVADPELLRRLLRQVRAALWPGAPPAPAITITSNVDIPTYRAERHRRARLAGGLPW